MNTNSLDALSERGISPDVIDGRPYIPWTTEDVVPVQEAYKDLPSARSTTTRWARQNDGLLIVRHAPERLPHLAPMWPEMRPNKAIRTKLTTHVHPTVKPKDPPLHPTSGNPLPRRHIHTAKAMAKHIEKAHGGVNVEEVHQHWSDGKYLFPPGPKITRHRRWVDQNGAVQTSTYKVKDPHANLAKRIDVHPLAESLFESARCVYFVIEGCLKADAILSRGEAVFSVPSVTLWDAPELEEFASAYLLGKFVVIVPDADWFKNGAVESQALMCRSALRKLGIAAVVAAPPQDFGRKGVDDFLAAEGVLDDLIVFGRERPHALKAWPTETRRSQERIHMGHLPTWLIHRLRIQADGTETGKYVRHDRLKRNVDVLDASALHAGFDGTLCGSLTRLAGVMGVDEHQVRRAVEELRDAGALTAVGSLETVRGSWRGEYYDWREDWEQRPTLVLHPDLRYPESKQMRLVDHDQQPNMNEVLLDEVRGLRQDVRLLRQQTRHETRELRRDVRRLKARLLERMPHMSDEEAAEAVDRFLEDVFAGD
jgi:hypothetical protein